LDAQRRSNVSAQGDEAIYKLGEELQKESYFNCTLNFTFQTFRTVKNIFLYFVMASQVD
jgi:hypothetical protein